MVHVEVKEAPFAEGRPGPSSVLSLHFVKDGVPGPERGCSLPILTDGDRHGLVVLVWNHIEIYLDQISFTIRTTGTWA